MKITKEKLFDLIREALEDYENTEQSFFGDGVRRIMDEGSSIYKDR